MTKFCRFCGKVKLSDLMACLDTFCTSAVVLYCYSCGKKVASGRIDCGNKDCLEDYKKDSRYQKEGEKITKRKAHVDGFHFYAED